MKRFVVFLVLVLALEGCASAPPPPPSEPEHDFDWAGQRYKVTREHGSSKLLLWRGEGITWELVGESPLRDSTLH